MPKPALGHFGGELKKNRPAKYQRGKAGLATAGTLARRLTRGLEGKGVYAFLAFAGTNRDATTSISQAVARL